MKETRACPFCGEEILAVAKKCKHCGEFLDESMKPKENKEPKQTIQQAPQIIPYSSKILIDCPNCGFSGKPKKDTPGNFGIELLLWFLMILPGLIYTIWRLCSTKRCKCPKCGNQMLCIHRN